MRHLFTVVCAVWLHLSPILLCLTKAQSIEVKLSEKRQRLNELLAIETRTAEQTTEMEGLTTSVQKLEPEHRAALVAEPDPIPAIHTGVSAVSPETRERLEIRSRTGIGDYLRAAAEGRVVDGAASEYSAACKVATMGRIPMAIFRDGRRPEVRAVTVRPAVDAAVEPHVPYVFERSATAGHGIEMPLHGPGQVQIPRVTTAPPADTLAKDAAAPATAAVIALDPQSPKRVAGQFEFRVEDLAVYPDLENVLGESIQGSLSNELDEEVFNGAAAGLNGLFTQAANVNIAGATETYATGIARFAALVDGRHAYSLADIRATVGPATYAVFMGLYAANGNMPLADYLMEKLGSFRVSDRIPAKSGNGQKGIVTLNAGPSPIRVYVWDSLQLVRDPYSGAGAGKVTITATSLVSEVYIPHGTAMVKEIHPKIS